jgi:hypothetical protein
VSYITEEKAWEKPQHGKTSVYTENLSYMEKSQHKKKTSVNT